MPENGRFSHSLTDEPVTAPSQAPPAGTRPRTLRSRATGIYRLILPAVNHFMDDDCTTMAAAIAYYTTFSIAPLLLIVISIVGLVFGRQAVQHEIQVQIQGLIG